MSNQQFVWILKPLLFLAITFAYFQNPVIIERFRTTNQIADLIPNIPTDKHLIFTLGYLSSIKTDESLKEASALVGYKFASHQELADFSNSLHDNSFTVATRIWNMVSLVNITIICGLIGMTITFLPALESICAPLMNIFGTLIRYLLANPHVLELMGYSLSGMIMFCSAHLPKSYGVYVALAGSIVYGISMVRSLDTYNIAQLKSEKIHCFVACILFSLMNTILTNNYDSKLCGFIAIFSLYFGLGFGVEVGTGYYAVGFQTMDAVVRCTLVSLCFVVGMLCAKNYGYNGPFLTPTFVAGPVIYFLGLLITASKHSDSYGQNQMWMISSLVAMLFVGTVYNAQSIVNVTLTYGALYILEKIAENEFWRQKLSLSIFVLSLLLFRIGLYLHAHPKFLVELYDPSK